MRHTKLLAWFALVLLFVCFAGIASAQAPGGIPARPRFQSMGVGTTPPAAGNIRQSSASPEFQIVNSAAGLNEKDWRIRVGGNSWVLSTYTDAGAFAANAVVIQRTGTAISSIELGAITVTTGGTALATQESGTFTASMDNACTTNQSITVDWTRSGQMATLQLQGVASCTGDSTSYATTGTPVPAALRPAQMAMSPIYSDFSNNGAAVSGCVYVLADGNIQFGQLVSNSCNATGWSALGARDTPNVSLHVTYMLGNP